MDIKGKDKRKRANQKFICYFIWFAITLPIIIIVITSYIYGNIPLIGMILIIGICILISYFLLICISKYFKKKTEDDRKKRTYRSR